MILDYLPYKDDFVSNPLPCNVKVFLNYGKIILKNPKTPHKTIVCKWQHSPYFSTQLCRHGVRKPSLAIFSLFVLTAPGQVLVSGNWDTPRSLVKHREGLECQVGLDARTHDPEWVLRMWLLLPDSISFQEGGGVPYLRYGVYAAAQRRKGSTIQCQLAVTSLSPAFLTHHSVFPPFLLVQLYMVAENSFWWPCSQSAFISMLGLCCLSHVNVSCSQPEDARVSNIQYD